MVEGSDGTGSRGWWWGMVEMCVTIGDLTFFVSKDRYQGWGRRENSQVDPTI